MPNRNRDIGRIELQELIQQNLSTETIARHFGFSSRTISRKIKAYDLKGLRTRGRKPRKHYVG